MWKFVGVCGRFLLKLTSRGGLNDPGLGGDLTGIEGAIRKQVTGVKKMRKGILNVRPWKFELQNLANELKLPITVCHLPPGTSKWHKIEHRLLSFISINSRGKPLRSHRTIVQLIASTTTDTGPTVRAELDESKYPKAAEVSDQEFATINIKRHSWRLELHHFAKSYEQVT